MELINIEKGIGIGNEIKNQDKEEIKSKEQSKTGNQRQNKDGIRDQENEEEFIKVTIAKKAETAIGSLLARVNDGFEGGRISRQDLISWILAKFTDECTEHDIKAIRADHFDEIVLLELSLKRYKQAGGLPPELKKLLLAQAGLDDLNKRSGKKSVDNKVNQ